MLLSKFVFVLGNVSIEKEEGCEYVDIVGDDICDDQANTKACAYDFGDCCSYNKDRSLCQECICNIDLEIQKPYLQDSCVRDSFNILDDLILHMLGNGKCELNFNSEQFDFDLGDCCLRKPRCSAPVMSPNESLHPATNLIAEFDPSKFLNKGRAATSANSCSIFCLRNYWSTN